MDFVKDIIKNCDSIVSDAKYMYACWTDMEISMDDALREKYDPFLKRYLDDCRKMRTDLIACFGIDNAPAEPDVPEIDTGKFHIKDYKKVIFESNDKDIKECALSLERTKAIFSLRQMLCGRSETIVNSSETIVRSGETIVKSINCIEDIYNSNKGNLPLEKAREVYNIVLDFKKKDTAFQSVSEVICEELLGTEIIWKQE